MGVLLNIDAGEHVDEPDDLFGLAHVVSIACGGHAGDEASMERALSLARRFGAHAGAHPSYPDRAGFGRNAMVMAPDALADAVAVQVSALAERAARLDVPLVYVKPHGALYHAANADRALAEAILLGAAKGLRGRFTLVGPPKGELASAAKERGVAFAREGFADRRMRSDGSLVPRSESGAMITDPEEARAQARTLARSGTIDTVCVHGDSEGALAIARAVRGELDAPGPS